MSREDEGAQIARRLASLGDHCRGGGSRSRFGRAYHRGWRRGLGRTRDDRRGLGHARRLRCGLWRTNHRLRSRRFGFRRDDNLFLARPIVATATGSGLAAVGAARSTGGGDHGFGAESLELDWFGRHAGSGGGFGGRRNARGERQERGKSREWGISGFHGTLSCYYHRAYRKARSAPNTQCLGRSEPDNFIFSSPYL